MTSVPRSHVARRFAAASVTLAVATGAIQTLGAAGQWPQAHAAPCPAAWSGVAAGVVGTPAEEVLTGMYRLASQSGALNGLADTIVGSPMPWFNGPGGYMPELTGRTQTVQQVTGRTSPNRTADRFGITGTDLGIMWDNGNGEVLMAVGDTMGNCIGDTQWRSNVLLRSNNHDLSRGFEITSAPMEAPDLARSVVPRTNLPGERTVIPTAGIEVGGRQYMRFMSVVDWARPGEWNTNFSALAESTDNGESWHVLPRSYRIGLGNNPHLIPPEASWTEEIKRTVPEAEAPTPPPLPLPGQPVITPLPHKDGEPAQVEITESVTHGPPLMPQAQMSAFLKRDGFVYEYLTPSGRQGDARLARVTESAFTDPLAYEYWDGGQWVKDPNAAAPVIPAKVSEMSVGFDSYLGKYIALYTNAANHIVMRQADRPEGPWSGEDILLSSNSLPTLYGAYIHPWSLDGRELYFTVSTWDAYNVFLMRSDLDLVRRGPNDFEPRPDPSLTGEAQVVRKIPLPGF